MRSISRLIRFATQSGKIYYGEPTSSLGQPRTGIGDVKEARVITGHPFGQHSITDQVEKVTRLLSPLAPQHVATVRCLGLNYEDHARETNSEIPQYPVLFYKPRTSLTGAFDQIPVPPMAQEIDSLDYEVELVVVVGKQGTNIPEGKVQDHIFGYAVGNDVSHRDWQMRKGGGQWSLGKCFDGWAPWGPGIVPREAVRDPQKLKLWTKVNGRVMQVSLSRKVDKGGGGAFVPIFNVNQAVSFLSQGVTLLPGDVIFTGTPAGVAVGREDKPFLKDGDIVEVGIEGIGSCMNKVAFVKPEPNL